MGGPTSAGEERPIRSLAIALLLTISLPAAALAQDAVDEPAWPSVDELRAELQAIGYDFTFDPAGRAQLPPFEAGLPTIWRLSEPLPEGDELPEGSAVPPFTLQLIDDGSGAAHVLFAGNSADGGAGELVPIATVLMELESRLPDASGLDEAVWFLANKWQTAGERSAAPCVFRETDDAVMLLWFGGEGEEVTSFFGTVGPTAVLPEELEMCRQTLAQPPQSADADGGTGAAPGETSTGLSVDFSVPPEEAVEIIDAGTHTVIDVRSPAEYEQAHVVGALNIDVESPDFAERIAELDPAEPYLVYCRTGRRSDLAAQQMAAAGFTDIVDAAGLADLARAGAPIE